MAHKVELAPTGRASCRACKHGIAKGALRFAEEFANPYSEDAALSFRYWHLPCAAAKVPNELGPALAAHARCLKAYLAREAERGHEAPKADELLAELEAHAPPSPDDVAILREALGA